MHRMSGGRFAVSYPPRQRVRTAVEARQVARDTIRTAPGPAAAGFEVFPRLTTAFERKFRVAPMEKDGTAYFSLSSGGQSNRRLPANPGPPSSNSYCPGLTSAGVFCDGDADARSGTSDA
jgi:hypothetical protein